MTIWQWVVIADQLIMISILIYIAGILSERRK